MSREPDHARTAEALGAYVLGALPAAEVREAIDTLPRDQKEVVRLAYFGGFTHTQIAEMLDTPIGTVKGRMRLGLEKLRRALAPGEAAT